MRLHEDYDGIWRSLDDLPPILPWYRKSYLAALLVILGLAGCAHNPAYSWSQDNLKRNDLARCPSAIFVAPGGNLIQCQLSFLGLNVPEPIHYPKFDTPEEAAIAALRQVAEKRGGTYEWGGRIGRAPDGKYTYSRPHTDYEGDHVSIPNELPPDVKIVAAYHTHACIPYHDVEYFSPEDMENVIFSHEGMAFMGDFCTGQVHQYKLGDKPDSEKVPSGIWLTKGRIIGTFTLPGKMAEG